MSKIIEEWKCLKVEKIGNVRRITLLLAMFVFLFIENYGVQSIAAATNPFEGEDLKELKIGSSDWAYVAQQRGLFEEIFGKYGIKVTVIEGTIGQEAQLMARGDLHITGRMLYPYLLYRSAGADMIAVQSSVHPHPKITAIIVAQDSSVQKFEDLKGKKISSWRAGCPYMVLFELADKANWKQGVDWEYVNIPYTEHKDGLLSGEIDAISSHLLTDIIPMVASGAFREVAYAAEDGVYVNGGGSTVQFAPSEFAKKYPKIIKTYLDLQEQVFDWILENKDEAALLVKAVNRTPEEISKFAWDKERSASTWKRESDLAKVKRETKAMQDWLLEHGDIDQGKGVDVNLLFDPQFFN
jgi:ABC-type nitrate/sulfonate/bicarbonate transport system substrate-binding protein